MRPNDFALKLPDNLIQIDVDPLANGRTYPNQYFVCGDSGLALAGLAERIGGRFAPDPSYQADFATMKARARSEFLASLGVYGSFPGQLRRGAAAGRDLRPRRDAEQHDLGQSRVPAA